MTIKKAKSSGYNTVNSKALVDYIKGYSSDITQLLMSDMLESCDRTQLKAIASELETIKKRLNYALYGKY